MIDVWAKIPAAKGGQDGWSLVASGITVEQARVYKDTFLFPLSFQSHKEPA